MHSRILIALAACALAVVVRATDSPGPGAPRPPARTLAELAFEAEHIVEARVEALHALRRTFEPAAPAEPTELEVLELRVQRGFLGEERNSRWFVVAPAEADARRAGERALWFLVAGPEIGDEWDLGELDARTEFWSVAPGTSTSTGYWPIDARRPDRVWAPGREVELPERLRAGAELDDRRAVSRGRVVDWLERELELDVLAIRAVGAGVIADRLRLDVNGRGTYHEGGTCAEHTFVLSETEWRELRARFVDARFTDFPTRLGESRAPCDGARTLDICTRRGWHRVVIWSKGPTADDPRPWKRANELWDALPWTR